MLQSESDCRHTTAATTYLPFIRGEPQGRSRPPSCKMRLVLSERSREREREREGGRPRYNLIELFSECEGSRSPRKHSPRPWSRRSDRQRWGRQTRNGSHDEGCRGFHPLPRCYSRRRVRILRFRAGDNARQKKRQIRRCRGNRFLPMSFPFLPPAVTSLRYYACKLVVKPYGESLSEF